MMAAKEVTGSRGRCASPFVLLVLVSTFSNQPQPAAALDNGVGQRPSLGWNSWNAFAGRLDEAVVRQTAQLLVSKGLAAKGYVYLNLDDTWSAPRNATGWLTWDSTKFETPMPELVADVHAAGLKFGIYTDVGTQTCAKRPGTYGHEEQDARLFAAWQVDFVKSDSCFTATDPSQQPADGPRCYADYVKFAAALNATGRPMVHSVKGPCGHAGVCSPPDASAVAHMRRAAGDVHDNWPSILRVLESAAAVVNTSKPGFFADLDILEIGNGGLTQVEERAVFSLWCAVKSPLLLGNNLSSMAAGTFETVTNLDLLAVNQDVLGVAATRVANDGSGIQLWAGPLGEPRPLSAAALGKASTATVRDYVVVVFNTGTAVATVDIAWNDVGACTPGRRCAWDVRDLWYGNISRAVTAKTTVTVASHGAVVLRLENASTVAAV
mmetsp:Transcript_17686/g.46163  ORF Transcript_17686/g.46163 Transcript_17686/m.46163 type:complete len:437 (+) Transcript_17686:44-1354(+)